MENGNAAEWLIEEFSENQRNEIQVMFEQKLANISHSIVFWENKIKSMAASDKLYDLATKELEENIKNKVAFERLYKALFYYDLPQ